LSGMAFSFTVALGDAFQPLRFAVSTSQSMSEIQIIASVFFACSIVLGILLN
jgi:hypothetical protein